ncbi:hypothetical protein [Salinarimonas ramus]|uniref:Uncharacterized protein n=1 Tax=Salinarimonas ramus TaxID=690164 RepID=A0A917Q936_9HYPH|nr:hypothetical protein [Salinarimonas ramus]GGK36352.1 hypothetical protein GCM10011322_24160 [Salinarimonas ramus]
MPLLRILAAIAVIFWFSPLREGAGPASEPEAPTPGDVAARPLPELDRASLAALLAAAEGESERARALWSSLPEDARAALAQRIGEELAESAR